MKQCVYTVDSAVSVLGSSWVQITGKPVLETKFQRKERGWGDMGVRGVGVLRHTPMCVNWVHMPTDSTEHQTRDKAHGQSLQLPSSGYTGRNCF